MFLIIILFYADFIDMSTRISVLFINLLYILLVTDNGNEKRYLFIKLLRLIKVINISPFIVKNEWKTRMSCETYAYNIKY